MYILLLTALYIHPNLAFIPTRWFQMCMPAEPHRENVLPKNNCLRIQSMPVIFPLPRKYPGNVDLYLPGASNRKTMRSPHKHLPNTGALRRTFHLPEPTSWFLKKNVGENRFVKKTAFVIHPHPNFQTFKKKSNPLKHSKTPRNIF